MPAAALPDFVPNFPFTALGFSGAIEKKVTSEATAINTSIEKMELPFEKDLKQYVVANDTNVDAVINNILTLLADLKNLNVAQASLFMNNPAEFDNEHTTANLTSLATIVATNLSALGTAIPTATEDAMYNRARARILRDASRTSRRITWDFSARLPYAGMEADLQQEVDQDVAKALENINWDVTVKQADMTYDFNRKKIEEAIAQGQLMFNVHSSNEELRLQAKVRADQLLLENHWAYYKWLMDRALGYVSPAIDFALKAAAGADQITFENWRSLSKILADAQLQISSLVANLAP
jgi:hypothetical protein